MIKKAPKSKKELVDEVRTNQKVNHQKKIIREIISLAPEYTIDDFANHINVIAGLVLQAQKAHTNELKVEDLKIDLKVKDAPHPEFIQKVYDIIKVEKAPDEISTLLAKLVDHVHYQIKEVAFLEKKVSDIGVEEMLK